MNIIEITLLQNEEAIVQFTFFSDGSITYKKDELTTGKKARQRMTGFNYDDYNDIVNCTLFKMRKHSKTTCEVY